MAMSRVQRAHVFSAFDALKGYKELLKEQERVVVPKRTLSEDDYEILNRQISDLFNPPPRRWGQMLVKELKKVKNRYIEDL